MSVPALANRAKAGIRLGFLGDSLSMPVHWFYTVSEIPQYFPPSGITKLEDCPPTHQYAFLSKSASVPEEGQTKAVVGDVILKGRGSRWDYDGEFALGKYPGHVHQGMKAGDLTLNCEVARELIRFLSANNKHYDVDEWVKAYTAFLTADTPQFNDTFCESYHRTFFSNYLIKGKSPLESGDPEASAYIGGLVTVGPLVSALLLAGTPLAEVQAVVKAHVSLTHPQPDTLKVAAIYVDLITALLTRPDGIDAAEDKQTVRAALDVAIKATAALHTEEQKKKVPEWVNGPQMAHLDVEAFTIACPIVDSFTYILTLVWNLLDTPFDALLKNTNIGGENCHRAPSLGFILGAAADSGSAGLTAALKESEGLIASKAIDAELEKLTA